jgi:putative DNA primase/helicase
MLLEDSFSKSTSGPRPDEMELKGKRFAYASEIDDNKRFSQAAVKYYTGGNLVNARTLYDKGENKFTLTHLLILLTNDLPKARGDDDAFWARLHLVQFNISFVPDPDPNIKNQRKMDTNLPHKLEEEKSGILSWLVRGCLEYQRQGGLHPPDSVTEAKKEYREHEDIIGQFISLHCIKDKYTEVKSKDLYDHYMYWCKVNISAKYKMSTVKFADLLKKQGFEKKDDDSKGRFWIGLELKEEIKSDFVRDN